MQWLLIISVLPSIILGIYIYKNDKLDKESPKLLSKLFIMGIISIALTLFIEDIIDIFYPIEEDSLSQFGIILYYFLYVALVEEFSKWFFLKTVSWKSKEFNYLFDGLVYGAFVALGFATFENVLYVFQNGFVTGLIRAVCSVPGHFFDGIFMGYFLAKAKQARECNTGSVGKYMALSLIAPTVMHGIFDSLLSLDSGICILVFIVYVIGLYIISFRLIKTISKTDCDILNNVIKQELYQDKYCSECGHKLEEGKFCANCGAKRS